jgi:hypothetical protein
MASLRVVRASLLVAFAAAFPAVGVTLQGQLPAADTGQRDVRPSTLIGTVIDSAGIGVSGAEIAMLPSPRVRAITDSAGAFRMNGLPSGTVVFSVRRLGFQPATFTAVLRPGHVQRGHFPLTPAAHVLPTVSVAETSTASHWLDNFQTRRDDHKGGTFITRKDIERRQARTGIDVIREVPGIQLVPSRRTGGYAVMMTRTTTRPCAPTMYVHGMPYSGTMDDFTADDIEAVEVYVGVSEIPPEFDRVGRGVCGVINVWTRDPRNPPT